MSPKDFGEKAGAAGVRTPAQLRESIARLQERQEAERTRLARVLHDDVGQALAALHMNWSRVSSHAAELPAGAAEALEAAAGAIQRAVSTVRRLSGELRPAILDLSLGAAIEWQAEEFQAAGEIACTVDAALGDEEAPPELSTALFRIFQELLRICAGREKVTLIEVELRKDGSDLMLKVTADGSEARELTSDWIGVEERAARVGGTVQEEGFSGGIRAIVRVPIVGN